MEEFDVMDGMDCLRLMYEGKEVEGELCTYFAPVEKVFKEIVFSLDGKKYKLVVEEVL